MVPITKHERGEDAITIQTFSFKTNLVANLALEILLNALDGHNVLLEQSWLITRRLIDHHLLRSCLRKQVKHEGLLDFLADCLGAWTTDSENGRVRHGIPQGPEASGFFAECVL